LPPLLRKLTKTLDRNAAKNADKVDMKPDEVMHSLVVNLLGTLFGQEVYNGGALAAALNLDPDTVGIEFIDSLNRDLRIDLSAIGEAYRSAPLAQVVDAAGWLVTLAPRLLALAGIKGASQAEVEEIAGACAPMILYFLDLFRSIDPDLDAVVANNFGVLLPGGGSMMRSLSA
jgi:hypothetical protein